MTARATSLAARELNRPKAPSQRERILALLRAVGASGLTDEEMQDALVMSGNSQRFRRRELEAAGLVAAANDNGGPDGWYIRHRPTRSGADAIVWVAC